MKTRYYSIILALFLLFSLFLKGIAVDDLTLLGNEKAISYLKEAVGTPIKPTQESFAHLDIQDGAVYSDRVLIRFVVRDLPPEFAERVRDDSRLYGDYLPIAEMGTPQGNWYTPSSASRYSLISDGKNLLAAGLIEFLTTDQPEIVSFNFNQIPFELSPLAEGAILQLEFTEEDSIKREVVDPLSSISHDLEFSLRASAQTPGLTMLQPAVRSLRDDETLSQFGWITVHRETDGKQYAVTRGTLYGFNLADDSVYSPAHAYVFSGVDGSSPLIISMDHAYISRTHEQKIKLSQETLPLDCSDEELFVSLDGFEFTEISDGSNEIPTLRLYFDADPSVAAISVSQPGSVYEAQPAVCGFAEGDTRLICDLTVSEFSEEKEIQLHSIEYKREGPWEVRWEPFEIPTATPVDFPFTEVQEYLSETTWTSDQELSALVEGFDRISSTFSRSEGWVLKREEIKGSTLRDGLTSHSLMNVQLSHSIQEIYTHINADGLSDQSIVLEYTPEGEFVTGTWGLQNGYDVVLPQGLLFRSGNSEPWVTDFCYGQEVRAVIDSGAVYLGKDTADGLEYYHFAQSLLGDPEKDPNTQMIRYYMDPNTGELRHSEIECNNGGIREICLSRDIEPLQFLEELPEWLKLMTENIILDYGIGSI